MNDTAFFKKNVKTSLKTPRMKKKWSYMKCRHPHAWGVKPRALIFNISIFLKWATKTIILLRKLLFSLEQSLYFYFESFWRGFRLCPLFLPLPSCRLLAPRSAPVSGSGPLPPRNWTRENGSKMAAGVLDRPEVRLTCLKTIRRPRSVEKHLFSLCHSELLFCQGVAAWQECRYILVVHSHVCQHYYSSSICRLSMCLSSCFQQCSDQITYPRLDIFVFWPA